MASSNAAHIVSSLVFRAVVQEALRRRGRDAEVLALSDPLSYGPVVPLGTDMRSWVSRRIEYWTQQLTGIVNPKDVADLTKSATAIADVFLSSRPLVLWAGPSIDEQLFFVWAVAAAEHMGAPVERIGYVHLTQDPRTGAEIQSLNQLSPDSLTSETLAPHALTTATRNELLEAWRIITSSDPALLDDYYRSRFPSRFFPLLADRIGRLRFRYPDRRSGLNLLDRRLLELCVNPRSSAPRIVAEMIQRYDGEPDRYSDTIIHARLLRFTSAYRKHPLVELHGDPKSLRAVMISLTDDGKAVLAGAADAVRLDSIDDWVGGVHLTHPMGKDWRYDERQDRLVCES